MQTDVYHRPALKTYKLHDVMQGSVKVCHQNVIHHQASERLTDLQAHTDMIIAIVCELHCAAVVVQCLEL